MGKDGRQATMDDSQYGAVLVSIGATAPPPPPPDLFLSLPPPDQEHKAHKHMSRVTPPSIYSRHPLTRPAAVLSQAGGRGRPTHGHIHTHRLNHDNHEHHAGSSPHHGPSQPRHGARRASRKSTAGAGRTARPAAATKSTRSSTVNGLAVMPNGYQPKLALTSTPQQCPLTSPRRRRRSG